MIRTLTRIGCFSFLSLLIVSGAASAANLEKVDFRLKTWKKMHFDSEQDATKYAKTLKAIGCECKQESHGDHIDLAIRCPNWRSLKLKSHAEAHKWEAFLKKIGFETRHEH